MAALFPPAVDGRPSLLLRIFATPAFFRLWLVQAVGATGDWLGMLAVIYIAQGLYPGGSNARAAATSLVIGVRLLPHLFLSPWAGVLVDRFDRRKLMVMADLGRIPVLLLLPFTRNLLMLVVASVLLEAFTLVWTPAKEAITPHLVPPEHLTTANSLNMAAGFASFLPGSVMFAALAGLSGWLAGFSSLGFLSRADNQTTLPLLFDALTFAFSAVVLWRLALPEAAIKSDAGSPAPKHRRRLDLRGAWAGVTEGWRYAFLNPTVRAVNISLGIALVGGGMLVPLGAVFSTEVLGAGPAGYGLFTTAIGLGVAVGVVGITVVQRRVPKPTVFWIGLVISGGALFLAAASGSLSVSVLFLFVMGSAVGPVYVLGYSMLHENVEDEMRGRVFSGLNTLVRVCVFAALVIGPLLSAALRSVRITLWIDAGLMFGAGLFARRAFRSNQ